MMSPARRIFRRMRSDSPQLHRLGRVSHPPAGMQSRKPRFQRYSRIPLREIRCAHSARPPARPACRRACLSGWAFRKSKSSVRSPRPSYTARRRPRRPSKCSGGRRFRSTMRSRTSLRNPSPNKRRPSRWSRFAKARGKPRSSRPSHRLSVVRCPHRTCRRPRCIGNRNGRC